MGDRAVGPPGYRKRRLLEQTVTGLASRLNFTSTIARRRANRYDALMNPIKKFNEWREKNTGINDLLGFLSTMSLIAVCYLIDKYFGRPALLILMAVFFVPIGAYSAYNFWRSKNKAEQLKGFFLYLLMVGIIGGVYWTVVNWFEIEGGLYAAVVTIIVFFAILFGLAHILDTLESRFREPKGGSKRLITRVANFIQRLRYGFWR